MTISQGHTEPVPSGKNHERKVRLLLGLGGGGRAGVMVVVVRVSAVTMGGNDGKENTDNNKNGYFSSALKPLSHLLTGGCDLFSPDSFFPSGLSGLRYWPVRSKKGIPSEAVPSPLMAKLYLPVHLLKARLPFKPLSPPLA